MSRPAGENAPSRKVPSTLPLERILSRWDFYNDIRDNIYVDGAIAPGILPEGETLTKLPLVFETAEHYLRAYEPLYLLETNNTLHRAKEHVMDNRGEKMLFGSRDVMNKKTNNPDSAEDFIRIWLEKNEHNDRKYMENDILLLSQDPDPRKPCDTHTIAFVEGYACERLHVRFKIESKGCQRSRRIAQSIMNKSPWYVTKIDSVATSFREYIAMQAFPNLVLTDYLLMAAPDSTQTMDISETLEKTLKARFNASQLEAITSSRKVEGITLIQGPPGTGKTSTIIGILSVLLQCIGGSTYVEDKMEITSNTSNDESDNEGHKAKRMACSRKSQPWMYTGYTSWLDGEIYSFDVKTGRQYGKPVYAACPNVKKMWKETNYAIPRKVLVTAPSNGAVDEIIRRLVKDGLINSSGTKITPRLVRCGPNVHNSLLAHSLNTKATVLAKSMGSGTFNQQTLETAKQKVLDDAQVILATNSVAGSRDLQHYYDDFDTVVVDEASQGVEVSTLIPLIMGCRRLILVGDPKQLPATVFSQAAKECGYDRSLFQRLQESSHPVSMLNEQYRMHPQICMFPSNMFYDGHLKSHYKMVDFEKKFPAKWSKVPCFAPVTFFDVTGREEETMKSYCNEHEAKFIRDLVQMLCTLYEGEMEWTNNIGIISPYQQQVKTLKRRFTEETTKWKGTEEDFSTVDGFQGREKEIIIVSAVRSSAKGVIGFVRDVRRMNVAFTRPRRNLWIVGNASVLKMNPNWCAFLEFAEDKGSIIRVDKQPFFLHRWLKNYYQKNSHLERPSRLDQVLQENSKSNYSDGPEPMDSEMSLEELAQLYRQDTSSHLYSDMEDDYAEGPT